MFSVRFWDNNGYNILVGRRYSYAFNTWKDAWDAANAMLKLAYESGAVEMDINNEFYPIVDDEE